MMVCPRCKGSGWVKKDPPGYQCPSCKRWFTKGEWQESGQKLKGYWHCPNPDCNNNFKERELWGKK